MNVAVLDFATGLSVDLLERQPIRSNHYEFNCRWQQMFTGGCSKMTVHGAITNFGLVSTVIDS